MLGQLCGSAILAQPRKAFKRHSSSHSGSPFLDEIRRMVSSVRPRGAISDSMSVTKPYLYSLLTSVSTDELMHSPLLAQRRNCRSAPDIRKRCNRVGCAARDSPPPPAPCSGTLPQPHRFQEIARPQPEWRNYALSAFHCWRPPWPQPCSHPPTGAWRRPRAVVRGWFARAAPADDWPAWHIAPRASQRRQRVHRGPPVHQATPRAWLHTAAGRELRQPGRVGTRTLERPPLYARAGTQPFPAVPNPSGDDVRR